MKKLLRALVVTYLWLPLLPCGLVGGGVVLNQICEVANHGKFPVLMNDALARRKVDANGMLDDEHCTMTARTHLNWLGDIFVVGNATYSPGDALISAGEELFSYCVAIWGVLAAKKLLTISAVEGGS